MTQTEFARRIGVTHGISNTSNSTAQRYSGKINLESIVAKHSFATYVTEHERTTWFKIKNRNYSQMAGREKLFERERNKEPAPG
jgi:ATP-dependent DNA ligase